MAIFDGRLIDPGADELARTLSKAMKSANRENRYQNNRMSRDTAFWGRFAQDVLRGGPEGRRRSCKGGRSVPEVIAGWWTDPAGRKHVRVIGRTRPQNRHYSRLRGEVELRSLPPWWQVYPEAVLGVRAKDESERYLAVCRCGAVGTPESLGWMGDTCGPCFDRRADGGTPSGGFGQFGGWSAHLTRFGFTADGQHLVGQNLSGALWKVSRADGSAVATGRKIINQVLAIASTEAGTVAATYGGGVYRWDNGGDAERLLHDRQMWGRVALACDGSRIVHFSYQHTHSADLTVKKPKYARRDPIEGLTAVRYTPDSSRLLATAITGEVREVNLTRMTSAPVRADAFDDLRGGYAHFSELAVCGDGSSVLIRRDGGQPRPIIVRHVPLPRGPVVDLQLPKWHLPSSIACSPDGRYAVTAETESGWVGFWQLSNGKSLGFVRAVLEDLAWRGGQVEFAPDGRALAVAYSTGHSEHGSTVAVWPWPDLLQAAGVG